MKKKIIVSSILVISLIALLQFTVFADTLGKIQFRAVDELNEPVSGMEVAIYQVGTLKDNNLEFSEGFKDCNLDVQNLSKENIDAFEAYAKANATATQLKTTDAKGEFVLDNLELGVYLLVQNGKTEEYTMQTMLMQVPEVSAQTGFNYNITAKPKVVRATAYGGGDPNDFVLPSGSGQGTTTEDQVLPYTGVLNWPIPVLAVSGLAIFIVAWISFYSKKKVK